MCFDYDTYRQPVEQEYDAYYTSFDPHTQPLLEQLEQMYAQSTGVSSYERKTRMYELLCQACPVHLFRESAFFFEISSGRERYTWGGLQSPVGSFLHLKTEDAWLKRYHTAIQPDLEQGFLYGWSPVGFDHHCPPYDNLMALGLNGVIRKAEQYLQTCTDPRKQEFYRCAIRANQAMIRLAGRFADEAHRLAAEAADEAEAAHYRKIAAAAAHVPAEPPRTFYEAICLMLFYRECAGSVEGIGFSTFAQLDRYLYPFYRADLDAGRLTQDEARKYIGDLLLYTEVRFQCAAVYRETSTTFELGGCDRAGNPVYNELTALILDVVAGLRTCGTKINCRISKNHPKAYLEQIVRIQLSDLPTLMMHNDDVLIPARVRQGQDVEDARMYVGCGCHEVVLQGTEVCTRADTWISLPRLLTATMESAAQAESFPRFYEQFISNVKAYHDRVTALKNEQEQHWCEYDPLILYSSAMTGCLEQGLDLTEGGAKYNTTTLSMLGAATMIDSLYAIRQLVFEEKKLTMQAFKQAIDGNFENDPLLRQYIVNRLPKHGTNDPVLNAFSAQVLSDLSTVSGQTNGRGGKYMPAFYPHDIYRYLGLKTGATPDGRLANTSMSRGVSPSEFIETDSPLDVIHSLKSIDFTQFADSFITEMTLPRMECTAENVQVLTAIIEAFLDAEGSSLQFNLLDRDLLLDAQKNPEQHRNLLVRVCGYSALFVTLSDQTREEIIARAIR